MRIPEDAVFRFFEKRTQQSPAEEQRAEPVDSLAAGRDALARARSRRLREKQAKDALEEQKRMEQRRSDANEERRRQDDRRQSQQDVLLDTRTTPSRRRSGPFPEIDTEA